MSSHTNPICRAIADYVAARLSLRTEFVQDLSWEDRERQLDAGKIHVAWICGLPYVWKKDQMDHKIDLLAAPVMKGNRYRNRPVYFSHVVVHRKSPYQTFADLRGTSWAFNETVSFSGYYLPIYYLTTGGENLTYFSRSVESGTHSASLRLVINRRVDTTAIDCTVLTMEQIENPGLESQLRIIETLGPSPIPPWVISQSVGHDVHAALRDLLTGMHADPEGREILSQGQLRRFSLTDDRSYDRIRVIAKTVDRISK